MSETREAVIISAVRTPVGKFLGSLKGFAATDLGAIVVRESVKRAGVAPADVDDDYHMGCTGEVVSEKYAVSRAAQDEYALNSHRKAAAAIKAGKFKDEIVAVEI